MQNKLIFTTSDFTLLYFYFNAQLITYNNLNFDLLVKMNTDKKIMMSIKSVFILYSKPYFYFLTLSRKHHTPHSTLISLYYN